MSDAEWEDWRYDLWHTARLYGLAASWKWDMAKCQIKTLAASNEALMVERDALRMALVGLGGTEELRAIYKDGVAT